MERHITEYGVVDFFVGHYGSFDSMAARVIKEAKQRHKNVTLTLLLPYHSFERSIPTPEGFDGTFYAPDMERVPKHLAILRANRCMVDNSTHLIAWVCHPSSGLREVLEWALKRQKRGLMRVTNLVGWYPI